MDEGGQVREEFEAVWAVVRRLEAHIRRLEGTISELKSQIDGVNPETNREDRADAPSVPATAPEEPSSDRFDLAPPAGLARYTLVFDGGSIGNPGRGYGSFQITNAKGATIGDRLDFSPAGESITNNEAEYLTLIGALERLGAVLGDRATHAVVEIRGDSQLVINQLQGRWKINKAELKPLHGRAKALLQALGQVDLRWHGRANSVRVLGH